MDTLRRLYMVVVQNIRKAREKLPKKEDEPHSFKVNNMVLVKDPDAAVFESRYQPNFRVTAIFSNNRIEVQDECGHKSIRRSAHVKYIEPSEKVVQQLPSEQVLRNYGRSSKLLLAAKDIPDLQFGAAEPDKKGEPSERREVMEIMNVDTKGSCVIAPQNSDFREHSINSLESAAGEAQEQISKQRSVQKTMDLEPHSGTSECREHSQKLRSSEKTTDEEETSRNIVHKTLDRRVHPGDSENRKHSQNLHEKQAVEDMGNVNMTFSVQDSQCSGRDSDFPEHSQNSLLNGKPKVGTEEANVSCSDHDGQCLAMASEFRELSPNSPVVTECSEGTQKKQHTKPVCISEPSEYSRDSLGGVGNNVSVPSFS